MRGLPDLAEIEGLQEKIERWRKGRPKTRPMPEELWLEATSAAKRLGTGRVARALGLSYEGLKERVLSKVSGRGAVSREISPQEGHFIELPSLPVLAGAGSGDRLVVEIVATDGTTMTIRAREASTSVLALIHAFRSGA
jgi:hypothetical protein